MNEEIWNFNPLHPIDHIKCLDIIGTFYTDWFKIDVTVIIKTSDNSKYTFKCKKKCN